jgi:hypothetical protein
MFDEAIYTKPSIPSIPSRMKHLYKAVIDETSAVEETFDKAIQEKPSMKPSMKLSTKSLGIQSQRKPSMKPTQNHQ